MMTGAMLPDEIPEKQGLKRLFGQQLLIRKTLPDEIPEKQGLKLCFNSAHR